MTVDKCFLTNLKQCLSNYTIADMVDRNIITNYKTWLIDLDLMIKKLSEEFILTLLNLDKLVDKYAQQLNRNGKHLNCYTAKHCYQRFPAILMLNNIFLVKSFMKVDSETFCSVQMCIRKTWQKQRKQDMYSMIKKTYKSYSTYANGR